MKLLIGSFLTILVATVLGLGGTWLALSRGTAFGAVQIGAWTAWPRSGSVDIDPYSRAGIARTGQLPIGLGDGIAFVARADDGGRPFDGRCDVALGGTTPAARFWTLTLYDPEGRLVANSANRYGFTSQEIVRAADGSFAIIAAPRSRAGNWLPTGGAEHYVLVLRLYDTPVGVATRAGREAPMPAILTRSCP
ncbi:MAG TPA: DUF1214 domain-containing protein [Xanthobacteraceae bacterium]|nr:DUF1214 domain-containing protein [Xanthobacteraceae bacterium]